jgi:preprotein translocase subunit YajC
MDTLNAVVNLIGQGFFPIVVCGFLFWYVWNKDKQHKEEISELRKSIEANTRVLQKFVDKFELKGDK